ncbi:MAG: imidazole glycerol phosphate synthase subunit HisH [Phycisphaerales bacterium]|nr:imidazole glycerol phosphate synthase subunit HisH [Phycisphaerales bacterium]
MTVTPDPITIIDTGVANTASVSSCFKRLGCSVTLTHDAELVRDAPLVVLPGVGSFGAGMRALRSHGLDEVVIERVQQNNPLLGICLGLQLLCLSSEESPRTMGLGLINTDVTRFPSKVRTPQHGWNRVDDGYAYFSNTYRIESIPQGWSGKLSEHGGPFVAYLRSGTTLACQFHPELSGAWGANILKRWIESSKEVTQC